MTARCDHCGEPERFNVLCPNCEAVVCETCGCVVCCCEDDRRLCVWCSKPYDAHLAWRAPDAPQPRMPCKGLRAHFLGEKTMKQQPDKDLLAEAFARLDAHHHLVALVRAARDALDETEGTAAHAALSAALEPYRSVL